MDSDMHHPDQATIANVIVSARSNGSREFETFWRGLPKDGLIPHRRDVKPARAATLLRNIVMLEARLGEKPSLRIRLVGSSVQERIQSNITGLDYLDFRPAQYHADTLAEVRQMFDRPCGIWQMLEMHYERGFAQNFEMTAFPLLGDDADVPLILALVHPAGGLVRAQPVGRNPVLADTVTAFDFIDIGAEKPARPS